MTTRVISPPAGRVEAVASPPGSKSHSIRALFLAGLARGDSTIVNGLESDDTIRARDCLRDLGVPINEEGNKWAVTGTGGDLVSPSHPLDAGESGLTARFLMGASCLVDGVTTITGRGRLPERPMGSILDAIASLGIQVHHQYPWEIHGRGSIPGGHMEVDGSTSSQSISALLSVAPLARERVLLEVVGGSISAGYIQMTLEMMRSFGVEAHSTDDGWMVPATGYQGAKLVVPSDGSSMVYPAAAAAISAGSVTILGDPGNHPDLAFLDILEEMGCQIRHRPGAVEVVGPDRLKGVVCDMSSAPDSAVALAVLASVAEAPSRIEGLGSLRHKESDRIEALRTELEVVGAGVETLGDVLSITPAVPVSGGVLDSHNDHRLAMSLAMLGLITEGISIRNSDAVSKTWPDFWDWLTTTGARVSIV
ncbi:MAG TPA: 3-phosphoshikimate 1-carboxyvinyltransferase [Acidimicrobiia bacterium]